MSTIDERNLHESEANPRNWSKAYKLTNVVLVSLAVLYTNLATTVFAPAANVMQRDFGFQNDTVKVLTITIASLGFALGQLVVPPLSEVFGRMPVYRTSAIVYLGFTAGCSCSTHSAEFLVFRLCTGLAAASFMSTGDGIVADLLPREERGVAMATFTAGPLFGPVLGPITGGFITENLGWRWVFYLILILAGAVTIASFIFMRETRSATIPKRKAARLSKKTGNPNLRAAGDDQTAIKHRVAHALIRPVRFLVMPPTLCLIALYIAFNFGATMLLLAASPSQTYIIDVFGPKTAASAMASTNLLRNLLGAFLPLVAPSLYADLGLGWGNSVLAFIAVAFVPMPFFFYWHGAWVRERFPVGKA